MKLNVMHACPTAVFKSPKTIISQTFLREREIDLVKEAAHLHQIIKAFAIITVGYNSSALNNIFLDSQQNHGININAPFLASISTLTILTVVFFFMRYLKKRKQGNTYNTEEKT